MLQSRRSSGVLSGNSVRRRYSQSCIEIGIWTVSELTGDMVGKGGNDFDHPEAFREAGGAFREAPGWSGEDGAPALDGGPPLKGEGSGPGSDEEDGEALEAAKEGRPGVAGGAEDRGGEGEAEILDEADFATEEEAEEPEWPKVA